MRSNLFSHPRWTIAKRDLSSLSREKTIVLALLIQLFIAAFSSFLVVGLTSLYDPGATEGQQIVVGVSGDTQDRLVAIAEENDDIATVNYTSYGEALDGFDEGEVHAVVSGNTVSDGNGSVIDVDVVVPEEDLRTTLIVVTLREYLTDLETTKRVDRLEYLEFQPVDVPDESDDGGGQFAFTYTILIPLLLFLPPFISGSIVVDSITEELERGTLELLRVSPITLVDVVDGKAAGMIAIAPAQALLWILLLRVNGVAIAHLGWLLLFVTAIATITVVVGLTLGLLTRQRRQAQLLYSMLVLLLFGLAVVLPEHPASTVALLAADSSTTVSIAHVVGVAGLAVLTYVAIRRYVRRLNPESL